MKTVIKFDLIDSVDFTLNIPMGFSVLRTGQLRGISRVWVLVTPESPEKPVRFGVFNSGFDVPMSSKYIDTFFVNGDDLVLHLFQHDNLNG